mgnify:FL=1
MTEGQGTAPSGVEQGPEPQWRVEGAESYGDGGLGDTVVRIPRITDDGHTPELPTPPRPRSTRRRSGRGSASTADSAPTGTQPKVVEPVASAPAAPSGPAPVKPASPAPAAVAAAAPAPVTQPAPNLAPPSPFADPGSAFAPTAFVPTAYAEPAAVAAAPAAAAAAAGRPKVSGLRRTRKARLRLSRVDPWSVMKTSFLFSIAFGIMFWVAVSVVWTVIINSGLFDLINKQIVDLIASPTSTQSSFRIEDYISTNKVLGVTALLAVINVVISTALGTLTAFLYNLSANILGGLELTLAED